MDGDSKKSLLKGIPDQAIDNIRPDFTSDALHRTGANTGKSGNLANRKGSDDLRDAEEAAANQDSTQGLDARSGEHNVSSGFTNNIGKGGSVGRSQANTTGNRPSFLKRSSATLGIILAILGGGSGMYFAQASLPFTIQNLILAERDTANQSNELRSRSFLRGMIRNNDAKPGDAENVVKKNIFSKEVFKPTGKMKKKLAKNGITFAKGSMIFTDSTGKITKMDVGEFKTMLDTNAEFRAAYTSGTKNWRTSVAAFKDDLFKKLCKKFNLSKSTFDDYDPEEDPDGSKAREKMANNVDEATDISTKTRDDGKLGAEAIADENGNSTGESNLKTERGAEGSESVKADKSTSAVSGKLKSTLSKVGGLTSLGCGALKALSAITVVLAAYQTAQVMMAAHNMFEVTDKARTEDAASSPINALGKSLTMKTAETRTKATKNSDGSLVSVGQGSSDIVDANYEQAETEPRSAIQSEGLSSLFTGNDINSDDESVQSFNPMGAANRAISDSMGGAVGAFFGGSSQNSDIDRVSQTISDKFNIGLSSLTNISSTTAIACVQIEGALAATEVAVELATGISMLTGVVTGGISAAVGAALKAAWAATKSILKSAIMSIAISTAVALGTQMLVSMLERKMTTMFAGEDLGNAYRNGGSQINRRNHQGHGAVVANEEGYLASLIQNEKILQETAKNERLAYDPWDYRSSYTFAGQMAIAITPITLQSDSVLDSFKNFGSVVRNSVTTLMPGASAISAADKAKRASEQTAKNCKQLSDIGGVADAYCEPFVTTDYSTIEMSSDPEMSTTDPNDVNSPYNVLQRVNGYSSNNFKEDDIENTENPTINLNSNLGKFIIYCGQRNSPFGVVDQNILSEVDAGVVGGTAMDTAVGAVPVVGGIKSFITSASVLANWGWIDGSNCVLGHDQDTGNNLAYRVGYDEIRDYSRYAEDQSMAEAMGLIERSAVSVAVEEYYELHPIDNSFEGILARYSGMTKEDVVATIETVEFYQWLAQYDPTDYYPTPAIEKELPDFHIEDKRFIREQGVLAHMRESFVNFYKQRNFATA